MSYWCIGVRLPVCGPALELTFKSTLYLDFFVARPTTLV
ncbi:gp58 [Brochothrix phage A9]|uniref:Gp58 n=1 Tax=Brochothrix phage A9 TaxID=857312 RepID=D9J0K5_9CAUD|nr:gp58 [Brochothrix phage A9]ADJ53098.1 gp58 [Brochothrix phage A9]